MNDQQNMAAFSYVSVGSDGLVCRRRARQIQVGSVAIGGGAPISIQSMTNTDTRDAAATLAQIDAVARVGCEIIRVAVPDRQAVDTLPEIVTESAIPVIADIHFDYRLALGAIEAGVACIRINPGTMQSEAHRREVAAAAAAARIPIRIGVNSGSIEKELLEKHGGPVPAALVESAINHCALFENWGCGALKVSLKSSNVVATVAACRMFAARTDYPLHLGITEAGTARSGTIKSATGIGCLLLEGIGDTLRVSLTAPPEQEIIVAQKILEAVGLRRSEPEIVSCPTCGRTEIDLLPIVEAVEEEVSRLKAAGHRLGVRKIAIMGCVVNGPGEARDADLGIAGGKHEGVLFKHGEVVRKLDEDDLQAAILAELQASVIE